MVQPQHLRGDLGQARRGAALDARVLDRVAAHVQGASTEVPTMSRLRANEPVSRMLTRGRTHGSRHVRARARSRNVERTPMRRRRES